MHEHTFFSIISNMISDFHDTHLKSCIGLRSKAWFSTHLVIPSFHMAFDIFSIKLHIRLDLSHPMAIGLTHYIYGYPINSIQICTPSTMFPWRGMYNFSWCHLRCLCFCCEKCWVSFFSWANTCSPNAFAFLLILMTMCWHCVIHRWGPHFG